MSDDVESVELDLLLEGINRIYGYDFKNYARASLTRRIKKHMTDYNLPTISTLQDQILHDGTMMNHLADTLSVNVTSMFRDAKFYQAMRKTAMQRLATYPFLRFWVAGCSTGQEAYSLAIVLHEEGLLERSRIYATDFSARNIAKAVKGIFPLEATAGYTKNYVNSGGTEDFSKYYTAKFDGIRMRADLRKNISFAQHNLVSDQSFNEFHMILCRNVLIYFEQDLQEQVMHLLRESLGPFGFLCLGAKESMFPTSFRDDFDELGEGTRMFQMRF